jgi:hypothetical protein
MKSCKELNLPLCWWCSRKKNIGDCSTILYYRLLRGHNDVSSFMIKYIKSDGFFGDNPANNIIYMRAAIEQVKPEYLDFFDKMAILL